MEALLLTTVEPPSLKLTTPSLSTPNQTNQTNAANRNDNAASTGLWWSDLPGDRTHDV